jgi:hypothetical protein
MPSNEIVIPEDAGLQELRKLLGQAENRVQELAPKLTTYRINANNTERDYKHELAAAKVKYQDEKTSTMMNAKAAIEPSVRTKELEMQVAMAQLTMAADAYEAAKGIRDTLKAMVKSEQISY